MQDGSFTFYPIQPAPLQTWHIVLGALIFLLLIGVIIWKLRSRTGKNPGFLNLNGH